MIAVVEEVAKEEETLRVLMWVWAVVTEVNEREDDEVFLGILLLLPSPSPVFLLSNFLPFPNLQVQQEEG